MKNNFLNLKDIHLNDLRAILNEALRMKDLRGNCLNGKKDEDKVLFFDTDTYFKKSPSPLFDLINPNQALFYLYEGLIYKRKRFDVYVKNLDGKQIEINGQVYQISKKMRVILFQVMGNLQ